MGPANHKWVQYYFQLNMWNLNPSIKWYKLLSKFVSLNFVNDDFREKRNKTTYTIVKYASISYINKDV